jgi:hypothetical protein
MAEKKEEGYRLFTDIIAELARGEVVADLSGDLNDLVAAVKLTGKKGSLTFTLDVKELSAEDGTVGITAKIKVTLPKAGRGESLFFVTEDHNLSRRDPRQAELGLHEVGKPKP